LLKRFIIVCLPLSWRLIVTILYTKSPDRKVAKNAGGISNLGRAAPPGIRKCRAMIGDVDWKSTKGIVHFSGHSIHSRGILFPGGLRTYG